MALARIDDTRAKGLNRPALDAICLLVAGALRAELPTTEFTLAWQHSVEKTRWEERYRVAGDRLTLVEGRIRGLGAGREPPADAILEDGVWTWRPQGRSMSELVVAHSSFVRDYDVCWNGACKPLGTLTGDTRDQPVTLRACKRDR